MSDLVSFLKARLDEDEAAANAAAPEDCCGYAVHQWDASAVERTWAGLKPAAHPGAPACVPSVENADDYCLFVALEGTAAQAQHIARHDPARVLREVEAKRKILALHYLETESYLDADGIERPGHHCWECDQRDWPCPTVRALAAVYSDHPDYDPAWAAE